MMVIRELKELTFEPSGQSGSDLNLTLLPADVGGEAAYARAFTVRLFGTVDAPNEVEGTKFLADKLLQQCVLRIPEVAELVNLSGNRLVRVYRSRNAGEYPPALHAAADWEGEFKLIPGKNAVDVSFVVEFSDQGARKYDDSAIPCALLRVGELRCFYGSKRDAIPHPKADDCKVDLRVLVTFDLVTQREVRCPALPVLAAVQLRGRQPTINRVEGRITNAFIQPDNDSLWTVTDDYRTLGLSYGDTKVTEDSARTDALYDAFNRVSTVDIEKHGTGRATRTDFLPLVFAPGGKNGQHVSYETVKANAEPRYLTDKATADYALVMRYVLDRRSPQHKKALSILGYDARYTKTASHKALLDTEIAAFLPGKVVTK